MRFRHAGTPPRRRDGRTLPNPLIDRGRNTPASAGRTSPKSARTWATAEHPRVGGTDSAVTFIMGVVPGTPPRRRDGRVQQGHRAAQRRNTPASAGRTSSPRSTTPCRTEHPCVGGTDPEAIEHVTDRSGTPPRRRDGRQASARPDLPERNTPASAGRTSSGGWRGGYRPEHPRVGGTDKHCRLAKSWPTGTPPRRWDGRPCARNRRPPGRNTPASAGRTRSGQGRRPRAAEHPRVGGTDAS